MIQVNDFINYMFFTILYHVTAHFCHINGTTNVSVNYACLKNHTLFTVHWLYLVKAYFWTTYAWGGHSSLLLLKKEKGQKGLLLSVRMFARTSIRSTIHKIVWQKWKLVVKSQMCQCDRCHSFTRKTMKWKIYSSLYKYI